MKREIVALASVVGPGAGGNCSGYLWNSVSALVQQVSVQAAALRAPSLRKSRCSAHWPACGARPSFSNRFCIPLAHSGKLCPVLARGGDLPVPCA